MKQSDTGCPHQVFSFINYGSALKSTQLLMSTVKSKRLTRPLSSPKAYIYQFH